MSLGDVVKSLILVNVCWFYLFIVITSILDQDLPYNAIKVLELTHDFMKSILYHQRRRRKYWLLNVQRLDGCPSLNLCFSSERFQ